MNWFDTESKNSTVDMHYPTLTSKSNENHLHESNSWHSKIPGREKFFAEARE